jgi:hypothetical protein
MMVNLLRCPNLLDPSTIEDRNLIAQLHRLLLIVRDKERRDAETTKQGPYFAPQPASRLWIERAEWLIKEQQIRLIGKGTRNCDPLLLPTRKLPRIFFTLLRQPNHCQQLSRHSLPLTFSNTTDPQSKADILADGHPREERVILKYYSDIALPRA